MQHDENSHRYGQLVIGSFIITMHPLMHHIVQSFFGKHQIRPLQPRFGILQLLAFPKPKITFEREEISDCQ